MFEKELTGLQYISQAVGNPIAYTQGGGGNTSVKLSDNLMAVKASGFKLKQITPGEGYVVVDYKNIKQYFSEVDLSRDIDYEKDSVDFVKKNIVEMEGLKVLRPSVEAGFHSILKKYVIHTHPVYANMLCCTTIGKEMIKKIFAEADYAALWISYINPGFCLTLRINEEINKFVEKTGKVPEVIFMENHGLIVHSEDSEACVALHEEVNRRIRNYLLITEQYPAIELFKVDDNTCISKTPYLVEYFKGRDVSETFFDDIVLYPDQLVYLNGSMSVNGLDKKININTQTGEVVYKTNLSEAQTMEETLLAYIYVIEGIRKSGLPLKTMSQKEIDFIRNWESEAYRKSLVKSINT